MDPHAAHAGALKNGPPRRNPPIDADSGTCPILSQMNDAQWTGTIRSVGNIQELMHLARAYIASWDKARIALLPPDCRPAPMASPDDLAAYAVVLVRRQCSGEAGKNPELLDELSRFFATASVRLAEILAASRAGSRGALRPIYLEDE